MKKTMIAFRINRLLIALGAAAALSALMTMPVNADDVKCSDFEVVPDVGVIPAGENNFNVIVDIDCVIFLGANVNGNVIEPDDTPWSIGVGPTGNVNGTIEEKGEGFVYMVVGHDQLFNGNIKEEGPWPSSALLATAKPKRAR